MEDNKIKIKLTTEEDLSNIVSLWNNGEVMFYVGFPEGIGIKYETLQKNWLPGVNQNNYRRHYSIYHDEIGFCGESYYEVGVNGKTAIDIKLLPCARCQGIGFEGLKYAMDMAFKDGMSTVVCVDPHKENIAALKLYEKFGFTHKPHPYKQYEDTHHYLELTKDDFYSNLTKH